MLFVSTKIAFIVKDEKEKDKLLNAVHTIESVAMKIKWMMKWMDADVPPNLRILAFIFGEGLFFCCAFSAIFWLKNKGVLPGVTFSNELIARDESLHTEFGILMYEKEDRVSEYIIHSMAQEAVDCEAKFAKEALPRGILGMNHALLTQYAKFVADTLLFQLKYKKLFLVENPFPWMEKISMTVCISFKCLGKFINIYTAFNIG